MSRAVEAAVEAIDPQAAAEARVGTALDAKWTLDRLLGRGGMATVYAATHRSTRARAAVKVLLREFAQDEDVSQRFLREARIANSIKHPSRVAVLDEGLSADGEIFLVMDLLEGITLDQYLKKKGRTLSIEEKLRIFDPVLELLGECHAAGIIHRDIKPANIFVTDAGQVKVLDFGIARLREKSSSIDPTRQGTVLGTPAYMAPEQALGLGELVDGRADLWSVGACIYSAISGQRVHRARSENESMVMAATKSAESIAVIMPELPVEVVAFVDRSLAHDRADRFADAFAMRGELSALVAALRTGQVTSVKASRADAVVVQNQVVADPEVEASTGLRSLMLERQRSIWRHLTVYLTSVQQYGAGHVAATQPLRLAQEEIGQALADRPDALVWDVSPYGFTYNKTPLWEGEKVSLERAAYRLFSHGLRKVQWKAGITEDELVRSLEILVTDAGRKQPASDDPVADLWAQRFPHVGYLAIDSFAVGNADELEAFEAEAAEVARDAFELSMITKGRDDHLLDSLEARALQANLLGGLRDAATAAAGIALDVPTRAALRAQVVLPEERWTERFIEAVAVGLVTTEGTAASATLIASLAAWGADRVANGDAAGLFDQLGSFAAALAASAPPSVASVLERRLTRETLEPARFDEVLRKCAAGADPEPRVVAGVERVLAIADDDVYLPAVVGRYRPGLDARVEAAFSRYIARWAAGHDADLAKATESADAAAGRHLLALLAPLTVPAAGAAIAAALRNPSPEVRVDALGKLKVEHGHTELAGLLSDPVAAVRREALRVVGALRARAAGPALVRRVQHDSFRLLDHAERKDWLTCLHALNPVRAEELAVEMLANAPLVRDDANDRTRVLAAEVLAHAESAEALAAVRKACRSIWWNAPEVRAAAQRAATAIEARRDGKGGAA